MKRHVLERELIVSITRNYNVDYKDDKSYPYIAVTESDVYPPSSTRARSTARYALLRPVYRCARRA
jgi:excinuclease UvrABC nuclease subunit